MYVFRYTTWRFRFKECKVFLKSFFRPLSSDFPAIESFAWLDMQKWPCYFGGLFDLPLFNKILLQIWWPRNYQRRAYSDFSSHLFTQEHRLGSYLCHSRIENEVERRVLRSPKLIISEMLLTPLPSSAVLIRMEWVRRLHTILGRSIPARVSLLRSRSLPWLCNPWGSYHLNTDVFILPVRTQQRAVIPRPLHKDVLLEP